MSPKAKTRVPRLVIGGTHSQSNLRALFGHDHSASKPELAERFVEACRRGKQA